MKTLILLTFILFNVTSTRAEPVEDRLHFRFKFQCQETVSGQWHWIGIQRHYSVRQDRRIDQTKLILEDGTSLSGTMRVRSNAGVDKILTSFLQPDGLSLDFDFTVDYRPSDACHEDQMTIFNAEMRIPGSMQYLEMQCQASG